MFFHIFSMTMLCATARVTTFTTCKEGEVGETHTCHTTPLTRVRARTPLDRITSVISVSNFDLQKLTARNMKEYFLFTLYLGILMIFLSLSSVKGLWQTRKNVRFKLCQEKLDFHLTSVWFYTCIKRLQPGDKAASLKWTVKKKLKLMWCQQKINSNKKKTSSRFF